MRTIATVLFTLMFAFVYLAIAAPDALINGICEVRTDNIVDEKLCIYNYHNP